MNRKTLGLLALPFAFLQIVQAIRLGTTALLFVLAVFLTYALRFEYYKRRWRRRIESLRGATPATVDSALKSMSSQERIAARFVLGIRSPDQARIDSPDGEFFSYRRAPGVIREYGFWSSLVIASLALTLVALGWVSGDQRIYFLVAGIGSAVIVAYQLRAIDRKSQVVRVTPFGLESISSSNARVGISWRELGRIRNRKRPRRIELHAVGGKRTIVVGADLENFGRFIELLSAYIRAKRSLPARLIEETRTADGWAMEAISTFEGPGGTIKGTGYVVTPDGSRAGIIWFVGDGRLSEYMPPSRSLWGVYTIFFPKPVTSRQVLAENFWGTLPELQARYAELRVQRQQKLDAATAVAVDRGPSLRVTRIRQTPQAFLDVNGSGVATTFETGVTLEPLGGYWSERAALLLSSAPEWAVSFWTSNDSQTSCSFCSVPISQSENREHLIATGSGDRICRRCYESFVSPPSLGILVSPAKDPESPIDAPFPRVSPPGALSPKKVANGLARVAFAATLLWFAWIFLSTLSTDTNTGRGLSLILTGITLVVAFGVSIPRRLGLAFRVFGGTLAAGYALWFFLEAQQWNAGSGSLTVQSPVVFTGLLLLGAGVPLFIYAFHAPQNEERRPARGELFRARDNVELTGLVINRDGAGETFRTIVPAGEIFAVEYDPPLLAASVYAVPRRYGALERLLVPPSSRTAVGYNAYALIFSINALVRDFEKVDWYDAVAG
jgi:hypothetical protein